ncbi:MAG: hypothetical protein KDB88_03980 [Flavobacteriales bacterium]|nr:hypothetical protein [Flavobacteriales bacterium]
MEPLSLYRKHHLDKDHTSIGLFRALKEQFRIGRVFYPGSHVHITPSLVFPDVVYADSFRNTHTFFEDPAVAEYIAQHKEYTEPARFRFLQQDYTRPFVELKQDFDLVLSQYAGFVGQAVKGYLKPGGLLVCNNSHGDASMAAIDPDYELIGVYRRYADDRFSISSKELDTYLIPKKGPHPTKDELLRSMKGVAYTKSPSGYIFRKIQG